MGYPLEIVFLVWVAGFGALSWLLRERVVSLLSGSPLPRFLNYYVLLIPMVLVEEFLTCETPYFSCIQVTVPAFALFFALIYAVQKYARLPWPQTIILVGVLGWVVEFIVVNRLPVVAAAGPLVLGLMSVLCFLIYAVLAFLPSYYADRTRR